MNVIILCNILLAKLISIFFLTLLPQEMNNKQKLPSLKRGLIKAALWALAFRIFLC